MPPQHVSPIKPVLPDSPIKPVLPDIKTSGQSSPLKTTRVEVLCSVLCILDPCALCPVRVHAAGSSQGNLIIYGNATATKTMCISLKTKRKCDSARTV